MKKFYNKIPLLIKGKISNSTSNEFEVVSIVKLHKTEIGLKKFKRIGIGLSTQNKVSLSTILPDSSLGRHSKRNVEGYDEVLKSEPKVSKTFNLGERPIFGDWSKGSFPLCVTKKVFKRKQHPAKNLTISSEVIETGNDDKGVYYIVKVKIDEIFNKNSKDFEKHLLHGINVLMESHGNAEVFEVTASVIDYIASLSVDWEIFPPGTRDLDMKRILGNRIKLNQSEKLDFESRYDFLKSLKPIRFVKGLGGSSSYFGAIFHEDLVVFENIRYGNAIYVLYENWKEVSKLSRTEIISGAYNHLRIVHNGKWKDRLVNAINLDSAA